MSAKQILDEKMMREALRLAKRARHLAPPNPPVGCVVVKRGRVLARGFTHEPGKQHAEVDALRKVKDARGSTAYVTLEPCNHTGRTGPCTEALIEAGVARVVFGVRDPHPAAKGGLERLEREGIAVENGVLETECRAWLEPWLQWVTTGRPLITLKAAITLDGRLAARSGDSRWVSGEESRALAHRLRDEHQAILVGARTVEKDDPQLTTRLEKGRGHDPIRVVLDGKLAIAASARVLPALIVTSQHAPERPDLVERGAELVRVRGEGGRVDLVAMLEALGKRGIQSLLVEGGGEVHGQLLEAGLVDRVALFIAPKLIGAGGVPLVGVEGPAKMAEAWQLEGVHTTRLGDDLFVEGRLRRAP